MDLVISQVKGGETEHHAMLWRNADASTVGHSGSQAHYGMPSPSSEAFALPSTTTSSVGTSQTRNLVVLWDIHNAVFHFNNQGTLHSVKGKTNEFYHLQFYSDRN